MLSAVCTLFEKDYHFGLAALANSLHHHGYRGTIFAGFRGSLPAWASPTTQDGKVVEFQAAEGLTIRFVPVETAAHLTNYKPDFLLSVWQQHCPDAEALFYFDPDITVKCRWGFFEEWVDAGVAICADLNPSMPPSHPIRHAWRRFFQPLGLSFCQEHHLYFNAGFLGVLRTHMHFLATWKQIIDLIAPTLGGLQNLANQDRTFLFHKTDQDALNVATMCTDAPISPTGTDGMDFQPGGGGYIMSHAAGSEKPWRKRMLLSALDCRRPSLADRAFFRHVNGPIKPFSPVQLFFKKVDLFAGSAFGRYFG